MDWKPIETAPKDGTAILLFEPIDEKYIGQFTQGPKLGEMLGIGVGKWHVSDYDEYWADYFDLETLMRNPTHWMHLPEPPK